MLASPTQQRQLYDNVRNRAHRRWASFTTPEGLVDALRDLALSDAGSAAPPALLGSVPVVVVAEFNLRLPQQQLAELQ